MRQVNPNKASKENTAILCSTVPAQPRREFVGSISQHGQKSRNINRRGLNRFRDTLQACELNEIALQNRRFIWSNERLNPTLNKLDAVFCNHDCDIALSDHILHTLSSSLSDHCPLLLACARGPKKPRSFKFDNFWAKMSRFKEGVQKSWEEATQAFYHKLARVAKILRSWSRSFSSTAKLHLHMALEVIL
jgi:hypothetical protein